jgi:hypothetical protein
VSFARRSLQVVAFVCTLVIGVSSMAVIVTQTTWFKEWLRGFIVRQAEDYVNGRLSIGRLDGNLFFGVEMEDVDVTMNGKTVVDIKDLGLDYNAFTFISGHAVLDAIRLDQPVLLVEKNADGWNLMQLIKARTPDPDEPKNRPSIEIGEIGISDGTLVFEGDVVGTSGSIDVPSRLNRLDASVGVTSDEDELKVTINHASLRAQEPAFGLNALSGTVRRRENVVILENVSLRTEETSLSVNGSISSIEAGEPKVDLTASSDKFDLAEIGRLVPALRGYELQPAFEITAKGPVDEMIVALNVREQNLGALRAALTVDSEAPGRRIAGDVSMEHLNVGPLAKSATLKSDITGHGTVDLALPEGRLPLSGTYSVAAPSVDVAGYRARDVAARGRIDGQVIRVNASAAAYGGRATASGTVKAGQPLALDLTGSAANMDLRNLPPALNAPGVPSKLQFTYRLTGRGQVFSGDVRMARSTLAGATIADGTTGSFRVGGGAPSYAAKGEVANLDVQQVGRGFGVNALAADRYRSNLNAAFDVKGSGGGRYPLTLDATGTITDSQMFGATFPRLDFTTNLSGGDAHVKAVGQFANLNPEVVTGSARTAGDLSGAVDVDTTIRDYTNGVTVDEVDAKGRVNLANSSLAGFGIDTGVIDGSFANREGQINQLAMTGPDLNIQGHGPIALNEAGSSNLTLHLETPALDRVGTIVNQPLKGAALIDAVITGNAANLKAQGTLKGSNIAYRDNGALALDSTFDVAVPNLAMAEATVKAKSLATFLEVGGQKINEVAVDATYAMDAVEFNATAKQEARELQAAGSLLLHPDHQEVHVKSLALRSEMIQWATAPGSEATIQYGGKRIEIEDLQLVSGDQTIAADGVIGSSTESLKVQARNVDVAQLDALMLGDQRIAGRFTGNAVVSGPTSAPRVAADFTLSAGAFRTFMFESLAGKVDYAARGVTLDVKLQQNPQAWLTAKGAAPLSLFRANPPEVGHTHAAPAAGEAVEIDIATSQIDLGVVQGFTSYVTNVTGSLQANVKVTGSGYDPHMSGAIEIRGGAFAVPELGTSYTGLDTRIDLRPDEVNISQMRILDAHGQPMTIGGTLGVHERTVGAVDVKVQSDTFEVIDNDLGRLKLDTDLRFTGEVRAPRLEGSVDVHTGTVDVAEILMQATSDAYSTTAVNIAPKDSANPAPESPRAPGLFDRLDMNIDVGVPSNLVVNGRNIRPANAPIDVGDISATVGGAIQVKKAPGDRLRLSGEVNTVRGSYTFQGRRFDIERDGRIRFTGSEEIDPLIDLRASRTISGVQTFVRIRGTMREPELSFSSSPPLEEADILSLIVFNQPINELGEGQQISLAQRASALAGGYLASGLATSIGTALKLDEFQIQAAGDQGGGPQLTVGEQVGDNLFFRLRQGFGSEQATELILEYQIKEYLRLQGTAAEAQGGTQRTTFRRIERGGLDLIFFFNY